MPELNDTNLDSNIQVEYHPSSRVQKNHPLDLVIGDVHTPMQTRTKLKSISKNLNIDENANLCLFSCFLSQIEPKKTHDALKDPTWVEAMQEELLQFKLQEVWQLVNLPIGKRAIGTKWIFINKKDERGIVIKNKARLVAQGFTQEEEI